MMVEMGIMERASVEEDPTPFEWSTAFTSRLQEWPSMQGMHVYTCIRAGFIDGEGKEDRRNRPHCPKNEGTTVEHIEPFMEEGLGDHQGLQDPRKHIDGKAVAIYLVMQTDIQSVGTGMKGISISISMHSISNVRNECYHPARQMTYLTLRHAGKPPPYGLLRPGRAHSFFCLRPSPLTVKPRHNITEGTSWSSAPG